jgi:hypothetical protein
MTLARRLSMAAAALMRRIDRAAPGAAGAQPIEIRGMRSPRGRALGGR